VVRFARIGSIRQLEGFVRGRTFFLCFTAVLAPLIARSSGAAPDFRFDRDTLAFANETVFEYREGHASLRNSSANKGPKPFTRRCFVLCRTAMQFRKFARFDRSGSALNDKALAVRIRAVTRHAAWREPLPINQRVVFPGYTNLRAMSKARARVLQENIGLGWPTYLRLGNFRMFYKHGREYQEQTHAILDASLARGELFVGYLSTYPKLSINHAVLVYTHKSPRSANGIERYTVYDPNHPKAPRELSWSPAERAFSFQKDWDFVGGFVRVYQVYGKPLQ
jgi:hypothetical protein